MMQKNSFNDKITQLAKLKRAASPVEQIEIDYTIQGMKWAFGEGKNETLHEKRMELLYSENPDDKRNGEAYRKGMDIVLYSVRGKKKEVGTVNLSALRVSLEMERGLINLKKFLGFNTVAPVRKAALRWYIEMMSEKHNRDFFK